MNLRRQLLLVSLLILVLPWAGCQFVRETESALREGQQQMLSGTAKAIADALSQFYQEFPDTTADGNYGENQVYGHPLSTEPLIDGYFDDWSTQRDSIVSMRGKDGAIEYVAGVYGRNLYLYVSARDQELIYERQSPVMQRSYADSVSLVSIGSNNEVNEFIFRTEAPGGLVALFKRGFTEVEEPRIAAHWQDVAAGYQLEARIPLALLGERIGIVVTNTDDAGNPGIRSSSYSGEFPGRFVTMSAVLQSVASDYVQPGLRLIITDKTGWRLADAGELATATVPSSEPRFSLSQAIFGLLLEPGATESLAGPDPSGREQQRYVRSALNDNADSSWFRNVDTGGAVIAVAYPVWAGPVQTGAIIMQQGTDLLLSMANESLTRLMNLTLIATLIAAFGLLGYARWLSGRIAKLSEAAERAMDEDSVRSALPSALANDEVGDLSRSFSRVLKQLGEYNEYLRSLASKLSHELRTPLTIVTSSLENLEHESLDPAAADYTARAKDGAKRLQNILSAMSEASRVEQLMESLDPERFNLHEALQSTVDAYADAWPDRTFNYSSDSDDVRITGSPELLIQMLDKLVENAVEFTDIDEQIELHLARQNGFATLTVSNPGPPLPDKMRGQLFDSLISVRSKGNEDHLGLGLYIARLIALGHRGEISADNIDGGVAFYVRIPILSDY